MPDLCREDGISTAKFYKWRSKYGGMDASMVSQMKALEEENRRLKRMHAKLSMLADPLKDGPVTPSFRQSLTPQKHLLWKKSFDHTFITQQ